MTDLAGTADRPGRPRIGEPAPAMELPADDGTTWRLAERSGRVVVAIFHRHIH